MAFCSVAVLFAACEKNEDQQPVESEANFEQTGAENGYGYVDLGLPSGLKWATCNVGADKPEACGNYYAWGETSPKAEYSWDTYKYMDSTLNVETGKLQLGLTKYCTNAKYGGGAKFVDGKVSLDPEDDAAAVNMGGKWRMPSDSALMELEKECTWTWALKNGVKGYEVKGSNGHAIFLPASGCRYADGEYKVGSYGRAWSNTISGKNPNQGFNLFFSPDGTYDNYYDRFAGYTVRAVCK